MIFSVLAFTGAGAAKAHADAVALSAQPVQLAQINGQCAAKPPPRVRLKLETPRPHRNFSRTKAQLKRADIDTELIKSMHNHQVGGLTSSRYSARTSGETMMTRNRATGETCIWYSRLDVTVTLNITVYVAREYRRGSCEFRAIWDHEMKHVEVARDVARRHAPRIRAAVERIARELGNNGVVGPLKARDVDEGRKRMEDWVQYALEETMRDLDRESYVRQNQIDTPAEYARVARQCSGF